MTTTTVKFFGQYLLEKGRISNDQLIAAVAWQQEANTRLGDLALARGYLTESQAQAINVAQRTTDRLFGDLAVDMGYLAPEQLAELVEIQRTSRLYLGEALVQQGILTPDELERELAAFRADQQSSQMMIRGALVHLKGAEFVVDTLDLVLKLFKRMVHENVLIEDCHQERDRWITHDLTISQRFTGDVEATFVMGLPEPMALKIASKMLDMKFTKIDDLVLDATKEFVNVICGNVCAKLSQRDLTVDLQAPKAVDRHTRSNLVDGYTVITSLTSIEAKLDVALVQHQP